ncbi:MAG: cupredoxin domain-containing protein [Armatimonadota bacterium]|nr:cupredoxin domain-containing protein [Armatimonadota bacterium]
MGIRLAGVVLLAGLVTLATPARTPAQTRAPKVYEITMTSFKFEPNQIRVTEGDTVILRLRNADQFGRTHNFASAFLLNIPLVVRGDGLEGIAEGRKFVSVEAGKTAEVEFTVRGRGSYAFLCTLFDHAARGQTGMLIVGAPAP